MAGWVNKKNVVTAVVTAGIIAGSGFMLGHLAEAEDSHDLAEQSAKTQASMARVLEELTNRVKAEDAKLEQIRVLCLSRKLKDRDMCAEAGVELP